MFRGSLFKGFPIGIAAGEPVTVFSSEDGGWLFTSALTEHVPWFYCVRVKGDDGVVVHELPDTLKKIADMERYFEGLALNADTIDLIVPAAPEEVKRDDEHDDEQAAASIESIDRW